MTIALPARLMGDQIIDADNVSIALLRGEMAEYRECGAEIVVAVNSHADLLAAAKAVSKAFLSISSTPNPWHEELLALDEAIIRAEQI